MAKRAIIYISHRGLMLRDRDDYSDMFELAGTRASVEYRTQLSDPVDRLDVLIFDEADYFLFTYPHRFESMC